jgi:uncharacterized protein involved in exopolysaccharide biosynthesis
MAQLHGSPETEPRAGYGRLTREVREKYENKATSYDRVLESLQSAKIECRAWKNRFERETKTSHGNTFIASKERKMLRQHHSQLLGQLTAKHTTEVSLLRYEAEALKSQLDTLESTHLSCTEPLANSQEKKKPLLVNPSADFWIFNR